MALPAAASLNPKSRCPAKRKISLSANHDGTAKKPRGMVTVEWPPLFKHVEKTHRALNLVYTFCRTRQQILTIFETMKSAVQSHTHTELTIEDVALAVAVRPTGLRLCYADRMSLELEIRGGQRDDTFKKTSSRGLEIPGPAPDASVGGVTGLEGLPPYLSDPPTTSGREVVSHNTRDVLYLEFLDDDLKRQVLDKKTGQPTKPTRRLRHEKLRMPVYGHQQLMKLMTRRNDKFRDCLDSLCNECQAQGADPEERLRKLSEEFIPIAPNPLSVDSNRGLSATMPEAIPTVRRSISEIVQELKQSAWYTGQIVPGGHRVFEAQAAVYSQLDFTLSERVTLALRRYKGIEAAMGLYTHQTAALNDLHAGRHVVVATSTGSGKSLIYQLPVVRALECDPEARALFIFPTKALAQDQHRSIRSLFDCVDGLEMTLVETYDGDTPMENRARIRDEARVIFTNPDMLHISILPQEERWRTFLKNLKFVVVDELHYYNGLLGSHVAFIMRRLRRICAAVGNRRVQFISCSATVANPQEHFKAIFGVEDVQLIDVDGSPSGKKEFLCWNTPFRDPGDPTTGRGSTKHECSRLFCHLILRGVRLITFCRTRVQCEGLLGAVKQELSALGRADCIERVMGYRGGYTAQDRRRIEGEMFTGRLLGIVATTALELGVDIGSLDCVLIWGFPYTVGNLRQQSGRAGRRNRDSLTVLIGDRPVADQHYMQHPDELFSRPNAELYVDLENMLVREAHLQCAAMEMPISPAEDWPYFGNAKDLMRLCEERLERDHEAGSFYHCHSRFRPAPWRYVAIRDINDEDDGGPFAVVDVTGGRNIVLEEMEPQRATFTIYDGAIFLHQGHKFLVRDFRPEMRLARVERVQVEWTTTQRDFTDVDPIETEAVRRIGIGGRGRAYFGTVRIRQQVFGYFKQDGKGRVLDAVAVDNPAVIRHSKGMWLDVPGWALALMARRRLLAAAAIHAAEHALMGIMATGVVMRSTGGHKAEVKTECRMEASRRKRPGRVWLYDGRGGAGGSGVTARAFEAAETLLKRALERLENCRCRTVTGCCECVGRDTCVKTGGQDVMSKAGARVVLASLLEREVDEESVPMGPDDSGCGLEVGSDMNGPGVEQATTHTTNGLVEHLQ